MRDESNQKGEERDEIARAVAPGPQAPMGMLSPIDVLDNKTVEVRLTRSNDGAQASCKLSALLRKTESSYGQMDDLKFWQICSLLDVFAYGSTDRNLTVECTQEN